MNFAWLNLLHSRPGANLGAAPLAKDFRPISSQSRVNLRHDAFSPFQQKETNLVAAHVRIPASNTVNKRSKLTKQLHADQSAADDHKRELSAFQRRISFSVGAL